VAKGRTKSAKPKAAHTSQCTICKHPLVNEIEAAYVAFNPLGKVGQMYGVSRQAILRHAEHFGWNEQRAATKLVQALA
jgi:hypothetical protein